MDFGSRCKVAVIGMEKYKDIFGEEAVCFLSEEDEAAACDFIIKRNNDGLFLCANDEKKNGFTTICNSDMEEAALRSLVQLLTRDAINAVDWYDIEHQMKEKADYFTKKVSLEGLEEETRQWMQEIAAQTDITQGWLIFASGDLSMIDMKNICDAWMELEGASASELVFSLVYDEESHEEAQISLWINSKNESF